MHFAKTLETTYGRLNFYFNKIFTATGECFHISVVQQNKTTTILMDKDIIEGWSIINRDRCPDWIQQLEPKLRTVIALYSEGS